MTKRINISIPDEKALRDIDRAAKRTGESRSQFLIRAATIRARATLGKITQDEAADLIARLANVPTL